MWYNFTMVKKKRHRKYKEIYQYISSDCLWVIELQVIWFEAVRFKIYFGTGYQVSTAVSSAPATNIGNEASTPSQTAHSIF